MIVTRADCAGNQSQASVTYTVDNTPPSIIFELTAGKCLCRHAVVRRPL
jgi:hypothetical protein